MYIKSFLLLTLRFGFCAHTDTIVITEWDPEKGAPVYNYTTPVISETPVSDGPVVLQNIPTETPDATEVPAVTTVTTTEVPTVTTVTTVTTTEVPTVTTVTTVTTTEVPAVDQDIPEITTTKKPCVTTTEVPVIIKDITETTTEVPETTTEVPETTTEVPAVVQDIPEITTTKKPCGITTEVPVVITTEVPIVTTTEVPIVTTTEVPVVTTTEVPVVTTTEVPVVTTTEVPVVIKDIPETTITTKVPCVTTTEVPVVIKDIPETTTTKVPCVTTTETPVVATTSCDTLTITVVITVTDTTTVVSPTETCIQPLSTGTPVLDTFCRGLDPLLTLSDGTQSSNVTCSDTVQGVIPSIDNMVSTIIKTPDNNSIFALNDDILIQISSNNMNFGFFTDPNFSYYTDAQSLNAEGKINGHSHVVIEEIKADGFPDPKAPIFFRGLDQDTVTGELSLVVPGNVFSSSGIYRICTITSSSSHQPILLPIARRGTADDCIRINIF
jgi:hypothetical protein